VESIRQRSFGGHEAASYAQVYFRRDDLTMMLLEHDLSKSVRRLLTAREAGKVLDSLRQWNGSLNKQWKAREDDIRKAMEQGDPYEYAKVYKGLTRLAAKSDLRPQDRQLLNQSLDLLTEELALSLGKTSAQTRKLISEAGAV
jgi:RNA polymerase-interacting CarD/CdnL/TRCF family regulator